MKYKLKAALLAAAVSACSVLSVSAAEAAHPAAVGTGTTAELPLTGAEALLLPISDTPLSDSDFQVHGVSLGDSISSVIHRKGLPEKTIYENTRDSYVFKDLTVKRTAPFLLSYSGRADLPKDFVFPGKGVSEILAAGPAAVTPRNVGVGTGRENLIRAYGRPLAVLWDGKGHSFDFRYGLGNREMVFTVKGDQVSSIRMSLLAGPVNKEDLSYLDGEGKLFLGDKDFRMAGYELGSTFKPHSFEEWEKKMANPREEILYFPGYAVRLTVKSSIISALFLTDKRMVTSRGLTLGDDVSTVELLYGKPHRLEMNVSGSEPKTSYIYFSKGKSNVLIINFSKNKVEGIVSAMNPTK